MYGVFRAYHVFLLAGMPVCYIYRQQEGRQAELPKGRRDFKMATLDVTEERRRAIDRVLIALVAIATSGYAIFILFEMR